MQHTILLRIALESVDDDIIEVSMVNKDLEIVILEMRLWKSQIPK